MNQLTQNLKSGAMSVQEVPFPALQSGQVLVRNHYSLISSGTEGKTVRDARLGLVSKAIARKEEVKKVIRTIRTIGLRETYKLVMNRLDSPSAMGYSCAGEVIAVAQDVHEFRIGDRVACAGSSAVHAEVVAVPVNLVAALPPSVSYEDAAFTTLGAIALQGIRQGGLNMGEHAVVIGLGLIGQLTLELLKAGGIRCTGIDMRQESVDLARSNGHSDCHLRTESRLEEIISSQTGGHGADAVIITASSNSTDPVNLAGTLCRMKGKVIIVGAVPTGFERKDYFRKELELRMSMSYGPGRYDPAYEQHGVDYPYAYVRWTENRNMQAFLELLASRSIQLQALRTHVFPFAEAKQAFDLIVEGNEFNAGVLLKYESVKQVRDKVILRHAPTTPAPVRVGMIGAGSFGQNFLIPALEGKVQFKGLSTSRPNLSRHIAEKYGFDYCTGETDTILNDPDVNTVIIATRHDTHAGFVLGALAGKKHVFTEKPLCLHTEELENIRNEYNTAGVSLMVGFNRRFAPSIVKLKERLHTQLPCSIQYRINAGPLAKDHWINDPLIGGGRLLGEACHFIDLCAFLTDSLISHVSASAMKDSQGLNSTFNIQLEFENGSIASINYFSNGDSAVGKERIEIYNGGLTAIMDDFKELHLFSGGRCTTFKGKQDKGHRAEMKLFADSIRKGEACPIPFDSIYNTTLATLLAKESIALRGDRIALSSHA